MQHIMAQVINWTGIQQKKIEIVHTCTNESTVNTHSHIKNGNEWNWIKKTTKTKPLITIS